MKTEELIKEIETMLEGSRLQAETSSHWDDMGQAYIRGKIFAYEGIKFLLYGQKYEEEKKK